MDLHLVDRAGIILAEGAVQLVRYLADPLALFPRTTIWPTLLPASTAKSTVFWPDIFRNEA